MSDAKVQYIYYWGEGEGAHLNFRSANYIIPHGRSLINPIFKVRGGGMGQQIGDKIPDSKNILREMRQ